MTGTYVDTSGRKQAVKGEIGATKGITESISAPFFCLPLSVHLFKSRAKIATATAHTNLANASFTT